MGATLDLLGAGARFHQSGCMGCIGMGQAPASARTPLPQQRHQVHQVHRRPSRPTYPPRAALTRDAIGQAWSIGAKSR